jgi:hypothetical protein
MKQIQITLTPPESKRIIAMGVKKLPFVQQAMKKGIILIALGSTNACVAEELTGKKVDHIRYGAGYIDGEQVDGIIKEMTSQDVAIKGANALDPQGAAGVMMSSPVGDTTGSAHVSGCGECIPDWCRRDKRR